MKQIDRLLFEYGDSHQNSFNKKVHWICVPLIMFSLFGLLTSIPFSNKTLLMSHSTWVLGLALLYYLRLSFSMFIGFLVIGGAMVLGNWELYQYLGQSNGSMALISILIFAIAWAGQFYGHKVEGKKPSFLKDLQFLLIGPAWLLHFIYKRIGIPY